MSRFSCAGIWSNLIGQRLIADLKISMRAPIGDEAWESLSDQNFKTVYEVQYIWQMGLWRLLALFEGIVSQSLPDLARKGIQAKLDALKERQLIRADEDQQLRDWIRLRNVLSRQPVEAHSIAHQLELGDLQELAGVTRSVLQHIRDSAVSGGDT